MKKMILFTLTLGIALTAGACHVDLDPGHLKNGQILSVPVPEAPIVSDFVDGNRYGLEELLILENGVYTPYVVLTNSYDGRSLLLRRDCTLEAHAYAGDSVYGDGDAYYPGSLIDTYLQEEFPAQLTSGLLAEIPATSIQVYEASMVYDYTGGLETISRQFFLLSAGEHGLDNPPGKKEGTPIKALKNHQAPAHEWLRSAYLPQHDVHAFAVSKVSTAYENVRVELPIRPAFTLPGDLAVVALEDGGYALACDVEIGEPTEEMN